MTRNRHIKMLSVWPKNFLKILVSWWFKRTIFLTLVAVVIETSDFDKKRHIKMLGVWPKRFFLKHWLAGSSKGPLTTFGYVCHTDFRF